MAEKEASVHDETEIEITPEMIEVGTMEYCRLTPYFEPEEDIVRKIFKAMMAARKAG